MDYSTVGSLTGQLRALGVRREAVVLVHSSYRSLGEAVGGALTAAVDLATSGIARQRRSSPR